MVARLGSCREQIDGGLDEEGAGLGRRGLVSEGAVDAGASGWVSVVRTERIGMRQLEVGGGSDMWVHLAAGERMVERWGLLCSH